MTGDELGLDGKTKREMVDIISRIINRHSVYCYNCLHCGRTQDGGYICTRMNDTVINDPLFYCKGFAEKPSGKDK